MGSALISVVAPSSCVMDCHTPRSECACSCLPLRTRVRDASHCGSRSSSIVTLLSVCWGFKAFERMHCENSSTCCSQVDSSAKAPPRPVLFRKRAACTMVLKAPRFGQGQLGSDCHCAIYCKAAMGDAIVDCSHSSSLSLNLRFGYICDALMGCRVAGQVPCSSIQRWREARSYEMPAFVTTG